MKKITFTLLALLSMTLVMAQNEKNDRHPHHRPDTEKMVSMMAKDLNLSDDQKAKVLTLMKERDVEMQKQQQKNMKERKAQHEAFDQQMKSILTANQYKTWQSRQNNHHGPHPGGPRPAFSERESQ